MIIKQRHNFLLIFLVLFLCFSFTSEAEASQVQSGTRATTLYVKPSPTDTGDCSSWDNACGLATAFAAASSGYQVYVTAGTYHPHATDRSVFFTPGSGIKIYGGFPSGGGDLNSRDWEANPTNLSGDIGTAGVSTDNSYHVLYFNGITNTLMNGFFITNGYANGPDETQSNGAGIFLTSSSPILRNLEIRDNTVINGSGGGVYAYQSDPTLDNVTFTGNASNSGGGMYNELGSPVLTNVTFNDNTALIQGGGLHTEYTGTPTLTDVTFTGNSVTGTESATMCYGGGMSIAWGNTPILTNVTFTDNTSAYIGGGLSNENDSSIILTNGTFTGNSADNNGGGMYSNTTASTTLTSVSFTENSSLRYGGGLLNTGTGTTVLDDVTFTANTAQQVGGGMMNSGNNATLTNIVFERNQSLGGDGGGFYTQNSDPTLTDISFIDNEPLQGGGALNYGGNPTYTNVTFSGNTAQQEGGGMANKVGSHPTLINVTFSGNNADKGGAIYNLQSIVLQLTNVTIYQNMANTNGGAIFTFQSGSTTTMINSLVGANLSPDDQIITDTDSTITITYSDVMGGWPGVGNIDDDPKLLPLADNGGFTKTHALGFGSPAIDAGSPTTCPLTDQRGMVRPFDGDNNGTAICDMGSYEVQFSLQLNFIPLILN